MEELAIKELNAREKLLRIQLALKAPKSQYNDFGKFKYRNCEDILEAAKPLLEKYECLLTLEDTVVMIGDRYYVRATVEFLAIDNSLVRVTCVAYAREEENKKGMDGSQITGAASSYARKYALNGLFLIDDNKDSDTTNKQEKKSKGNNPSTNVVDDFMKRAKDNINKADSLDRLEIIKWDIEELKAKGKFPQDKIDELYDFLDTKANEFTS